MKLAKGKVSSSIKLAASAASGLTLETYLKPATSSQPLPIG
jgi:hypothetical protein